MSWVAVGVGGASLVGSVLSSNNAADASRSASGATQANINRGLNEQSIAQDQSLAALLGGTNQNLDFLNQARGLYQPSANLAGPAFQNLQNTGTAAGRSAELTNIMADPNNAALFDELNRVSQNNLSGLSARRSGFGIGQTQGGQLNLANNLLDSQDQSQQFLANAGQGSVNSIANLLAQSGSVAGAGGANQANLIQQGSANRMNLLGQLGQAQSAGILGPANIQNQNMNSLIGLGGQLGGAYIANQGNNNG